MKTTMNEELGMRFNEGKLRFDLIPPEWDKVLAGILTFGAKKYAERNWENGLSYTKTVASLRRHLNSFEEGEWTDPESGHPHLGHVAWNALALITFKLRGIGLDDLPRIEYKGQNNGS